MFSRKELIQILALRLIDEARKEGKDLSYEKAKEEAARQLPLIEEAIDKIASIS